MRIVMLGGSGFVGHHLAYLLSQRGHRITILTRQAADHRDLLLIPGVTVRQADVYSEPALAEHFSSSDAVINLVGILNERGFGGRGFHRAHVTLTEHVIAACQATGVSRLLQMSALRAGEGRSHYLRSRGEAEARVKAAGAAGDIAYTLFQPSVIFGRGDSFINRFAGLLKISPLLPLARASARFQPVWVADVCQAFATALEQPSTIGKTLPLVGPKTYSLAEIVRYTAAQLGLRRMIVPLPDFLARVQAALMDFVPGKPFSSDNYRSLLIDSISQENGLLELGIEPTAMEQIVPHYLHQGNHQRRLDRYRQQAGREWQP
ncbi:MAG: complex I NDUFA9 subunit family protein [Wenzhouxiangellaceae bacterium]